MKKLNITPMVLNLVLINIAIYLVQILFKLELVDLLGLRYIWADSFAPYQIITHLFVHSDLWHLGINMFALLLFGSLLEHSLGPKKFLIFYFITALGASLLYSVVIAYEFKDLRMSIVELKKDTDYYVQHPSPSNFAKYLQKHDTFLYNTPEFDDDLKSFKEDSVRQIMKGENRA